MLRTPEGHACIRLHYSADPDLTPERLAAFRGKYTTEAFWRREMEIEAEALSGQRVYPEFNPSIHVIPHSQIPQFGCCYMAIDPHPRTPHAMLWVMIDAWSDWYVYRELWPSKMYAQPGRIRDDEQDKEFTTREYAETIAFLEGNEIEWHHPETDEEYGVYRTSSKRRPPYENIIERWMDQAGKAFRVSGEGQEEETYASRYVKFGIDVSDPKKGHQAGEDAVRALLKPRNHEVRGVWPRLHISDNCPELAIELAQHRYKLTRTLHEEKELKQDRSEFRCHLVDLLRYLATSDARYIARYLSRRHQNR